MQLLMDDELLLAIPEAELEIHSKYILLLFGNAVNKQLPRTATSELSCTSSKISLADPSLVFEAIEQSLTIRIINIKQDQLLLAFNVHNLSTLIAAQSILRVRLCEYGFERRYSFIKKIGKGAFSNVYLIERICDGKLFAAKIISTLADQKCYEIFINETKLLREFNHPNVIHLEGMYYSKKNLYQVLEYISGGTLLNYFIHNKVNKVERWNIMYQLTLGVEHLRQKRIVHRDIKLDNVLIRLNGDGTKDYVLIDFGLSSWIGETKPIFKRCGTPGYIAPQLLTIHKDVLVLSHQLDVFSLGVIFHYLIVGQTLFNYDDGCQSIMKQNEKFIFDVSKKMYRHVNVNDCRMLKKMLESDPSKRISTDQLLNKYILQDSLVQSIIKKKGNQKQPKMLQKRSITVEKESKVEGKVIKNQYRMDGMANSLKKIKTAKKQLEDHQSFIPKGILTSNITPKGTPKLTPKETPKQPKEQTSLQAFFRKFKLGKNKESQKKDAQEKKAEMCSYVSNS